MNHTSYMIREMPATDRPRERLWELGADKLKKEELIAILLRTGIKGVSAVEVARQLLRDHDHSLDTLARVNAQRLAQHKGVGRVKGIQLAAAFELAQRIAVEPGREKVTVDTPDKAADHLRGHFRLLDREAFRVLMLDTKNGLIRSEEISRGTLNASLVEPREVFKAAILASSASIILGHNHPSGDPTPSSEDIAITKRLVKSGELLNIAVLDHIIVGLRTSSRNTDYISMKELGLL
jgi:DNA repair protein RadC